MIEGSLISSGSAMKCFTSREDMKIYFTNKSVYLGSYDRDIRDRAYAKMGLAISNGISVYPGEPVLFLREHPDCYEILIREKCCYTEKIYQWFSYPIPRANE